ncbi:hypothetical protein EVAR_64139_1 [Eumeta japonica]|uniref:Uncharacterized protein n=1 Tax=Eumeta variegata TaxID=151549 RepID=A0A4C2A1C8_EUMVA|nr:hypothetical protein EVAR_64139_1 [Eumeta japonica]
MHARMHHLNTYHTHNARMHRGTLHGMMPVTHHTQNTPHTHTQHTYACMQTHAEHTTRTHAHTHAYISFQRACLKAAGSRPSCATQTQTIFQARRQASNSRSSSTHFIFTYSAITFAICSRLRKVIDEPTRWFQLRRIAVHLEL